MKKLFFILLAVSFLLSACASNPTYRIVKTDGSVIEVDRYVHCYSEPGSTGFVVYCFDSATKAKQYATFVVAASEFSIVEK
jgi:hypothetical protein